VRAFIADEPTPRPTVLRQNETHPFEVRIEDRVLPRERGARRLPCLNAVTRFSLDRLVSRDSGRRSPPSSRPGVPVVRCTESTVSRTRLLRLPSRGNVGNRARSFFLGFERVRLTI
jgi:hypothetical protein